MFDVENEYLINDLLSTSKLSKFTGVSFINALDFPDGNISLLIIVCGS